MAKIIDTPGLTFDDVLLVPRKSEGKRGDRDITTSLHPKLTLHLPIISSPMDTVTTVAMSITMAQSGGIGVIHRNLTTSEQVQMVREVKSVKGESDVATVDDSGMLMVGAAVGAGRDLDDRLQALVDAGVDMICVDSGHGYSEYIMDAIRKVKQEAPDVILMAGNIATYDGAKGMIECGVDIIRVGMGPGSICTTRIISGMGVPQVTSVMEAARAAKGTNATVIADGGIRQTGDIAKALAAGAHAVMLGGLLAGYDQSPGEIIEEHGKKYKSYRGMGSIGAMAEGGAERYGQDPNELKKKLIPEGVEGRKPYRGDVLDFLHQIRGSLMSSFYYMGARDMAEFHEVTQFIQITPASMAESHPHSLSSIDVTGGNYNAN